MRNIALLAALGGLVTLTAAPADARINKRQDRQQVRIDRGIANGRLTARETARVERQQSRIASAEARDRADGGRLTWRERYRLDRRQNAASRNIYRQKHDRQGD